MTAPADQPGAVPHDFGLLLPPGWVRLPVDDGAEAAVAELAMRHFAGAPAVHRDELRTAFRREVLALAAEAREVGGLDLLLAVQAVRGRPIGAVGVVGYVPPGAGAPRGTVAIEDAVAGLTAELVAELGGDGETELVPVADVMAVRHRYRREPDPEREGGGLPTTHVDYLVPVPATPGTLVLSFTTAVDPLADALVVLFDAIASTFHWVW